MIDPNLEVFRYTRLGKVKYSEYFSEEEWREQPDNDQWKQGQPVTERPFQVSGRQAVDYWLANEVVEDFAELKELYGLEADPALSEPGWAQFLIDAMAHPAVAVFLLVVGFSAIYAELHAPGIGIGGFLALVCFLLFFWSRFLGGTAGWLEVTLFVAGVLCLLLEVFVLPGFGIFGLGGGLLILVSLILASQTFFLPQNTYQAAELRRTLTMLGASAVGVIAAVVMLNRWLPRARFLGGMVLHPPSDEEVEDLGQRESLVHFESLLGAQGITTTQLTPSGKARFGTRLVDVMADSEVIPPDTDIVVVEVLGNRILVRPASEGDVSSSG
jgi:membrane-bound ClpP family serine protease